MFINLLISSLTPLIELSIAVKYEYAKIVAKQSPPPIPPTMAMARKSNVVRKLFISV